MSKDKGSSPPADKPSSEWRVVGERGGIQSLDEWAKEAAAQIRDAMDKDMKEREARAERIVATDAQWVLDNPLWAKRALRRLAEKGIHVEPAAQIPKHIMDNDDI